jgi:hypothetical protein
LVRTDLYNEAEDAMNVVFSLLLNTAGYASYAECITTLNYLVTQACQGSNSDTRGGSYTSSGDVYTADPTTLNCSC